MYKVFISIYMILISFTLSLYSEEKAVINGTKVNLREAPSIKSKVLHVFNDDDEIDILHYETKREIINGKNGQWVKVSFENKIGYLFDLFLKPLEFKNKRFISLENAQACCFKICKIRISKLNCSKKANSLDCDCGEECEGGGPLSMLYYGWTPDEESRRKYSLNLNDFLTDFKQYQDQCLSQ
ncbi:peptide-binding protein [Leptospira kmetyi]|uniref:SH3 domain-containing protein n=1 Tax=Leptospira kmetyi TaxID=408139 RepID=UPI000C299C82|nr:SH3 domain-containing protein [Leptospira kmetyi]PJZ41700.1 peptide-binding protein [Leptospira kmetyi]